MGRLCSSILIPPGVSIGHHWDGIAGASGYDGLDRFARVTDFRVEKVQIHTIILTMSTVIRRIYENQEEERPVNIPSKEIATMGFIG